MSTKLSKKIKDAFAAMIAVMILALILGFVIAPLFPAHAAYIQLVSVCMITASGSNLAYKILKTV
jgi:hypothetical protein